MAQLKDTVVAGNLRVTDETIANSVQTSIIKAPNELGGTIYSAGTNGQVLRSNGTNIYWGVDFYGSCETAAATAQKEVVCADFSDAAFVAGVTIRIKFTYANGVANPTLKINDGTAKTIYRYGTTAPSTTAATSWNAGSVVTFTYDGTHWFINNWLNDNTTSTVNQSAALADTYTGKYTLLHAQNTGTSARNGYSVYKSKVTYQPSTQNLFIQDKPVIFGEYSASSAPASPVVGQIWFKDAPMSIEEAKVLVVTSSSVSSLPTTISNSSITADMEVLKSELGNPASQNSDLTVTTAAGSVTISGTLSGSTTIKLWLMRGR